ncbi:MAG: septum formation initiator family protein [Tissierellia bacterium]|nr:septum formation initiator family protein [Tissierellia bacterium]
MKNKSKGFKYILIVMIFVLIYFAYNIHDQLNHIYALEKTLDEKAEKVAQLNTDIQKLEYEIENSGSLKFIEQIARDEYGMVKPKEVIFKDKDKENSTKPFENK